METAQDIIVAVQKLARKLETLEANLINDCGYYQSTIEELENGDRLTDEQLILLAYLLEEYPAEAEQQRHGMLFVNLDGKYTGKPMTSARLNDLFYQLKDRTGIKAHPHLFRHTFATKMLQKGYMDEYVQQLLGHKSIATTKDIYSHVLDEMSLDVYLAKEKGE